jgi:hypothetical protein
MPRRAPPRLPCHAMSDLAASSRATPALPARQRRPRMTASPCRFALGALPGRAGSCPARSGRACLAVPRSEAQDEVAGLAVVRAFHRREAYEACPAVVSSRRGAPGESVYAQRAPLRRVREVP